MKKVLNILKIVLLVVIITVIFGFSKNRNQARTLSAVDISFIDGNKPFITQEEINNLLIQNDSTYKNVVRRTVNLNEMEKRLLENPMVRNAEVYLSIDGVLGAKIEQRDPIGRIQAMKGESFYIDADGKQMPLSTVHSARVPIVSGVTEEDFDILSKLLLAIRDDEFMNKIVIGVNKQSNGDFDFDLRGISLTALLGKPFNIEQKFQNFKAFYKKTYNDKTIDAYSAVNLKYDKQVIAIKK